MRRDIASSQLGSLETGKPNQLGDLSEIHIQPALELCQEIDFVAMLETVRHRYEAGMKE